MPFLLNHFTTICAPGMELVAVHRSLAPSSLFCKSSHRGIIIVKISKSLISVIEGLRKTFLHARIAWGPMNTKSSSRIKCNPVIHFDFANWIRFAIIWLVNFDFRPFLFWPLALVFIRREWNAANWTWAWIMFALQAHGFHTVGSVLCLLFQRS